MYYKVMRVAPRAGPEARPSPRPDVAVPTSRRLHPPCRVLRGFPILALTLVIGGCGSSNSNTTTPEDPVPTTLTITPGAVAFTSVGEARALNAQVRDQNNGIVTAEVTWSSSDPSAVTIDAAGLATAVATGPRSWTCAWPAGPSPRSWP